MSPASKKKEISKRNHLIMLIVRKAFEMKEQGNEFYREKDYKRALAKYARVQCYTNAVLPSKEQNVQMYQNMNKSMKAMQTDDKESE